MQHARAIAPAIKCAPSGCALRDPAEEVLELALAAAHELEAHEATTFCVVLVIITPTAVRRGARVGAAHAQDCALDRAAVPAVPLIDPLFELRREGGRAFGDRAAGQ